MNNMDVQAFFDEATNTVSYVLVDLPSKTAAVIDSVLDYDAASGRTHTTSADAIIAWVEQKELTLAWVLETHVHADHLSAAPYIKQRIGGQIAICEEITRVQTEFGKIFNEGTEFQRDGKQFDVLLADGQKLCLGDSQITAIHTPGHTPACMTFVVEGAAFVGDTLFMPDFGTARCDFPGGSAEQLYASIQKILSLPDDTVIHTAHDYKAPGRDHYAWSTTVEEQKASNVHIGQGKTREEFVAMRTERDAKLGMPKLILPSVQVNMRAGEFPPAEADGRHYLKVPINGI